MKALKKTIIVLLYIIVLAFILSILLYKVSEYDTARNGYKVPGIGGLGFIAVYDGYDSLGIDVGDMIITSSIDQSSIKSGDIIAYFDESGKICFTRVGSIKGDTVQLEQAGGILSDNGNQKIQGVEGIYSIRIPYLGYIASFTDTPVGSIGCIVLPVIIVLLFAVVIITDIVHNTSRHKRRILRRKQRRRERYIKEGLNRRAMI